MSFYLKPPRGMIDFHILQRCVEERLQFFKNTTCSSLQSLQYMYEDSALDRAGHFTLRLGAVKYYSFSSFFITSELELLKLRLDAYKYQAIHVFLKTQLRHAKECLQEGVSEKLRNFLTMFVDVISKMADRSYRTHVYNQHEDSEACNMFTLTVPFQLCPLLIINHEFILKNGYIHIPCQNWKQLILALFNAYLIVAIREMHHSKNVQIALDDERIKSIINLLQQDGIERSQMNVLDHTVDRHCFPLCMQNLQNILLKKHRLAHDERFNLSLFLKDVGMSLNESIDYWKSEYSKEHTGCSKCSHSWQKDERRYVYGLRHMYGLEGRRKVYQSRSCKYFQNLHLNPMQEGGCPFKHFDKERLRSLLATKLDKTGNGIDDILNARSKDSLEGCKLYMKMCKLNLTDDILSFQSPVQYYFLMKR